MKVVHVLKKIESIDSDIRDLRKMEKSLLQNKSFTTPIYLSIEKQINILLGDRIKLLELRIENPPAYLVEQIEGIKVEEKAPAPVKEPAKKKSASRKKKDEPKKQKAQPFDDIDADSIPLMTQDLIDKKFDNISKETKSETVKSDKKAPDTSDDTVKLLDIALEKGTLARGEAEKDKKKVKFFKDNFPGSEY